MGFCQHCAARIIANFHNLLTFEFFLPFFFIFTFFLFNTLQTILLTLFYIIYIHLLSPINGILRDKKISYQGKDNIFLIPDDAVDQRKLGFQALIFYSSVIGLI